MPLSLRGRAYSKDTTEGWGGARRCAAQQKKKYHGPKKAYSVKMKKPKKEQDEMDGGDQIQVSPCN